VPELGMQNLWISRPEFGSLSLESVGVMTRCIRLFTIALILMGGCKPSEQSTSEPSSSFAILVHDQPLNKVMSTGIGAAARWEAFRVFADGRVEPLGFDLQQIGTRQAQLGSGSTDPLPSPDGRFVAYVQDSSLWLWTVETKAAQKLLSGSEPTKEFNGVLIHITAWKPDGSEILYNVIEERSFTGEGGQEEEFPDAIRKPAEYGFNILNLKLNRSRPVNLSDEAEKTWLPSGDFLTSEGSELFLRNESGSGKPLVSVAPGTRLNQVDIALKQNDVVATLNGNGSSQIQRINLQSGQMLPISPEGRFADYQGPTISPMGGHVGYIHALGPDRREFVLDGKPVYATTSFPRAHWIDEDAVAIADMDNVVVVRASDGTIVRRFTFPSK
jgi:hypothetical protein